MVIRHPVPDYLVARLKRCQHQGIKSSWVAGSRTAYRTSSMSRVPVINAGVKEEETEDEDDDGAESVAETETTDMSETNSLGSLTSVD